MQLFINEEQKEYNVNQLHDLLSELGLLNKKGIAVAVNDSIVRKTNWMEFQLSENDTILIITAAAGG